uniref:SH3 domain-binding glutamic acid-rich-like protein n=1 Tax=Strigamia maritima TaxID=126957 RepID=T1JCC8_STRMM
MVIKVYISGISASKEIKKRQQRALLILDSCKVDYEPIDITEPGLEAMREFMVQNSKVREPNKTPLSPQFFNDDVYCGDFEDFDSAVEINEVFPFLKLESNGADFQYTFNNVNNTKTTNGDHDKGDTRKSITPEKEENDEGEVIKDSSEKDDGDGDAKGEEEDDEFWAQDDSKKRKKEDDEIEEESKQSNEVEIENEDASKRLKTDGIEDEVEEAAEEEEVEEEKPEVKSEKIDEEEEAVEEEEEDNFWAGKGD